MHIIQLDLKHGSAFVDTTPITVDEKGALTNAIAKLCSPPIQTDEGRTQFSLLKKAAVFGKSADCVIEVGEGRVWVVTFLFDLIAFFESSILESKILKACEKSLNLVFISEHPGTAYLDPCEWGQVIFFYDAKQGDLSLGIIFQPISNHPA